MGVSFERRIVDGCRAPVNEARAHRAPHAALHVGGRHSHGHAQL